MHNDDIVTRPNKRMTFILDRSGSMSIKVPGSGETRLALTVEALKTVLAQLKDGDEFNIVTFAGEDDFTKFKDQMQPANDATKQAARTFLDTQKATGMTYLGKPLKEAVQLSVTESADLTNTIIILTDGEFHDKGENGKTGEETMIDEIRDIVDGEKAQLQINTISLGDETFTDQMGRIAHSFEGTYIDITGVEMKDVDTLLYSFVDRVSTNVLF